MSEFASTSYKSWTTRQFLDLWRRTEGRSTHRSRHTCIRKEIVTFGRALRFAVITICIKTVAVRGWRRGRYVSHGGGGRKEVFARAYSLITGGIAMRGTRFRKTWGARKSQASRVPSLPFPRFPHPQASRATCFLIPWPNSLCRGETLIDIPLLRFERGISRARNYLPEWYRYVPFSVDVDRVEESPHPFSPELFFIFARKWTRRFRDSDLLHSLKKFNFLVTMKGGMN